MVPPLATCGWGCAQQGVSAQLLILKVGVVVGPGVGLGIGLGLWEGLRLGEWVGLKIQAQFELDKKMVPPLATCGWGCARQRVGARLLILKVGVGVEVGVEARESIGVAHKGVTPVGVQEMTWSPRRSMCT